jgi:hypothetical protein
MASTLSSISRFGVTEPFNLQVSRGQIMGHSSLTIFGYNPDVDTAEESIWPDGGTVPHPTTAAVLKVSSTSASDTSLGTGARTVYLEGLDGSYNLVGETIVLNGQTEVNTTKTYLYVNQLYVTSVGTGESNAGVINIGTGTVTAGVPAVLYDLIETGYNTRTTAHYCVPAGYTAYLVQGAITTGQASGSTSITGFLKQHGPDGILRVAAVSTLNNGAVTYNFEFPIAVPEKNCIGASAIGAAANNSASAFFNLVLIKNDGSVA